MLEDASRPIRKGNFPAGTGRAVGVFKVREEVIRIRFLTDVETASHEVGHLIQKYVLPQLPLEGEMAISIEGLGRSLYGQRVPAAGYLGEGLAEFTRLYVADPAAARQLAPGFEPIFEAGLERRLPEVLEGLRRAKQALEMWTAQPDLAKVASRIAPSGATTPGLPLDARLRRFYTDWFDQDSMLLSMERRLSLGRDIPADESAYMAARALRHASAMEESFVRDGPLRYGTGGERASGGLPWILDPVGDNVGAFEAYLTSRRLRNVFQRGEAAAQGLEALHERAKAEGLTEGEQADIAESIRHLRNQIKAAQKEAASGTTEQVVEGAIAEAEARYPAFPEAAQRYATFLDAVQQWRRDAGLMSDRVYRAITEAWPDYSPLIREVERAEWPYATGGRKLVGPPERLKRYGGSAENILPPLEVIHRKTTEAVRDVLRNEVVRRFYRLQQDTEGLGKLFEEVPRSEANTVPVWIEGRRRFLRVHPELFRVLAGLADAPSGWIEAAFRPLTAILKYGVTVNPLFIARNLVRDQLTPGSRPRAGTAHGTRRWRSKRSGTGRLAISNTSSRVVRKGGCRRR